MYFFIAYFLILFALFVSLPLTGLVRKHLTSSSFSTVFVFHLAYEFLIFAPWCYYQLDIHCCRTSLSRKYIPGVPEVFVYVFSRYVVQQWFWVSETWLTIVWGVLFHHIMMYIGFAWLQLCKSAIYWLIQGQLFLCVLSSFIYYCWSNVCWSACPFQMRIWSGY